MAGIEIRYARTGKGIELLEKRSTGLIERVGTGPEGSATPRMPATPAYREFIGKHADAETADLYVRELRQLLGEPRA